MPNLFKITYKTTGNKKVSYRK